MIWRLTERALRRTARRLNRATRGVALKASRLWSIEDRDVDPSTVLRLGAVRLDRLGDLVLTLPALDDLASAFPHTHRVAVVRSPLAPLLRRRASIHRVAAVEHADDVAALASFLAALDLDLAVDFSDVDDLRVARALVLARVPNRIGLAGGGREVYYTKTADLSLRPEPLATSNGRIVDAAGGRSSSSAPRLEVSRDDETEAERLLVQLGVRSESRRIAVHAGGFYPSQRWPVESFAEAASALAARHDGAVILLGGPGEDNLVRELRRRVGEVAVAVPAVDVASLAAVMSRCDILLANNSGPLHLAGAVRLPTVSVMGPTDPARFWPMGDDQAVIRREDVPCSPCTRGRCGPHDCLRGIDPRSVIEAAGALLTAARREVEAPVAGVGA